MAFILNKNLAEELAEGSAVYSCGGGLERIVNKKGCVEAVRNKKIFIKSLNEFKKGSLLSVVYAVGKPEKKKYDFKKILEIGNAYISKLLQGKKLSGIVPGEIGIESLVLKTAKELDLPILDGDITGGRAVPEIQDDIFYIEKIKTMPLVSVSLDGEVLLLDKISDLKKIESLVRNFSVLAKGPVIVFDHIAPKEVFSRISLGTISRSIELGKKIRDKKGGESLKEILDFNKANVTASGKIYDIKEKKTENGFLEKMVSGDNWQVIIKNECIAVYANSKLIVSVPDIIVFIDKENGKPMHNTELRTNKEVWVVTMKAFRKWYTKRGLEIFGPRSLNLSRKI